MLRASLNKTFPTQDAERFGIDVVEDVVLTRPTHARLENSHGIVQAIQGQGCVHLSKLQV